MPMYHSIKSVGAVEFLSPGTTIEVDVYNVSGFYVQLEGELSKVYIPTLAQLCTTMVGLAWSPYLAYKPVYIFHAGTGSYFLNHSAMLAGQWLSFMNQGKLCPPTRMHSAPNLGLMASPGHPSVQGWVGQKLTIGPGNRWYGAMSAQAPTATYYGPRLAPQPDQRSLGLPDPLKAAPGTYANQGPFYVQALGAASYSPLYQAPGQPYSPPGQPTSAAAQSWKVDTASELCAFLGSLAFNPAWATRALAVSSPQGPLLGMPPSVAIQWLAALSGKGWC